MKASLAGRYASALFELARDKGSLDTVKASLDKIGDALDQSDDLQALIDSPAISRDQALRAMKAIGAELKIDALTQNFLGVLADNGRIGALGDAIRVFDALVAAHRGEARATVTSARALTDAQLKALSDKLTSRVGRTVSLDTHVDPDLLGGVRIQLGSELIDASVATKLNNLAKAMKG
ncbi:F0F1 ATP synthase subunit delta [Sphingomicrobium sp. GRR-S6-50]|uniref:ATP synthase subunit delta n=2 Tax=Sphingomicrobium sediminis TaxID=2950949 RepID=A0A9X2EIW2_9SPHN|nr:F0F1 ATP synthase subunit delta [Sphingomicrobium sediminis]